jgi:hypothetical protein
MHYHCLPLREIWRAGGQVRDDFRNNKNKGGRDLWEGKVEWDFSGKWCRIMKVKREICYFQEQEQGREMKSAHFTSLLKERWCTECVVYFKFNLLFHNALTNEIMQGDKMINGAVDRMRICTGN